MAKKSLNEKGSNELTSNESLNTGPKLGWLTALIGCICILLYSNTFQHRFVLDDHGIIKSNKITQAPVSWENTKTIFSTSFREGAVANKENTLYRPFTKLVFNIEWNLFDEDPHAFHMMNTLFYALTCMLLFIVLYRMFERKWMIPFLVTLLFAVHPIHVECVANVKSGDEILSLLGILVALHCLQLFNDKQKLLYLFLGFFAFLLASFSKESTIVALAIFPLYMYYFTNLNPQLNAIISGGFAFCSGIFLYARWASLHGYKKGIPVSLMDNYMANFKNDFIGRFPSAIQTLGTYLKTFVFPHPLSCDYSFSTFTPASWSSPSFLLSFIILTGLLVYAFRMWRKKVGMSFGILWFFLSISIVSNVFFLIGTSFGERLLFTPSFGLCLALVMFLHQYLPKKEVGDKSIFSSLKTSPLMVIVVLGMSVLFSIKTYSRNEVWSSDYKLFSTDIQHFPDATHLLYFMGNNLSDDFRKGMTMENMKAEHFSYAQIQDSIQRDNRQAIKYFNHSLELFPALPADGYNQLGKAYFNIGNLDSALKYYRIAIQRDSTVPSFINNLGTITFMNGLQYAAKGRSLSVTGPKNEMEHYFLLAKNHIEESKKYFLKAYQWDSSNADFSNNLGSAYGESLKPDSAIYWFSVSARADEFDTISRKYLDLTYRNLGDVQRADSCRHEYIMASQKSIERMNKNK